MTDSTFDPSVFLNATTTEAASRRDPLPVGDYAAEVTDVQIVPWQKKDDPTKSGIRAVLKVKVLTSSNSDAANIGYPELTLQDSVFIDTKDDGTIDYSKGKNSGIRIYREALDLNKPGQPFNFLMMVGRTLKVRIKHEVYQGEIQDRIDAPLKA